MRKVLPNLQVTTFILLGLSLFLSNGLKGQLQIITPTSNGSWTVPPGVTSVTVQCWGGGGGGGGATGASLTGTARGSGGGGGGYSTATLTVTPGDVYTYTIGAGGAAPSGGNGGTGGTSTFSGAAGTVTATGGAGGLRKSGDGGAGGTAAAGTGNFNGGLGGAAGGNGAGGGGGAGTTGNGGAGGNAATGTGGTGSPQGGAGGAFRTSSGDGNAGSATGGGGGGARAGFLGTRPGGVGGAGRLTYSFTLPPCSGAPTPGNTLSTATAVCLGSTVTLSMQNMTNGGGVTYQWQSADDAAFTVNIANLGTATTEVATITANKYYRCNVTCSGTTVASNPILISVNCVNMTNGALTTCSADFYDSGGSGADYGNNQNFVYTFTPTVGNFIIASFSSFSTELNYDGLVIYNGPNTSSSIISSGLAAGTGSATNCPAGSFYGTTSPGTVLSTHPSGALTFQFRSDGSNTGSGWIAAISCCSGSTVFNVTGGGGYCLGGSPIALGLDGSQAGVSYQLKRNGANVGSPIAGTGSALSFSGQTLAGNYTVVSDGTGGFCTTTMSGNAVITTPFTPTAVTAGSDVAICYGTSTNLSGSTYTPSSTTIISQNFESGIGTWTNTNTSTGGTPSAATWTIRTSPNSAANNANSGSTNFIVSNSDATGNGNSGTTTLVSPVFSTIGYSALSLSFKHYFRASPDIESANVDISTDGGTNWTNVQTWTATQGTNTAFNTVTINLDGYVGNSNMKMRFRYNNFTWDYYWCLDNILLTGTIPTVTYAWSPTTALNNANISNPIADPTSTTTYTMSASVGICTVTDAVVVSVNPIPSATVTPSANSLTCAITSIDLTAGGGTSFLWDNNSTAQVRTVNAVGTYIVTVTDLGCTATASSSINKVTMPPTQPLASVSHITASLSWINGGGSTSFQVRWQIGVAGFDPNTVGALVTGANGPVNLTGLTPLTDYHWYVRESCDAGSTWSVWVDGSSFTTNAAPPPLNDVICNAFPMPNSTSYNMGFGSYAIFGGETCNSIIGNNTNATVKATLPASSCGTNGKGLWYKFTTPACAASGVSPFAIQVSTSNSSTNFDTKVRVFSSNDNTCNGTLTEVGCDNDGGDPALGCEGGLSTSSLYNFTNAIPGNTYFVYIDGNSLTAAGDFELNLFLNIPSPTLAVNATTPDKMNISTLVSAPSLYTYFWKPQGASGYSMDNKTVNTYTTPLLAAGVTYDVQVMHRCASATSQLFRSDVASLTIPPYTNCVSATVSCGTSTSTSITVSWNQQTGAYTAGGALSGYLVYYRAQGTTGYSVWSNPAVTCSGGTCSYTIPGLAPGVTYEVWILTRCSAVATVKSNTVACSTTALVPMMAANSEENPNDVFTFEHAGIEYHDVKFDELALYGLNLPVPNENVNLNYSIVDGKLVQSSFTGSSLLDSQSFDFVLMPNPTSDQTTVLISAEDLQSEATVSVIDALGRVVSTQRISSMSDGINVSLETSNLANGVYNVCVKTTSQIISKKLVVQH